MPDSTSATKRATMVPAENRASEHEGSWRPPLSAPEKGYPARADAPDAYVREA